MTCCQFLKAIRNQRQTNDSAKKLQRSIIIIQSLLTVYLGNDDTVKLLRIYRAQHLYYRSTCSATHSLKQISCATAPIQTNFQTLNVQRGSASAYLFMTNGGKLPNREISLARWQTQPVYQLTGRGEKQTHLFTRCYTATVETKLEPSYKFRNMTLYRDTSTSARGLGLNGNHCWFSTRTEGNSAQGPFPGINSPRPHSVLSLMHNNN